MARDLTIPTHRGPALFYASTERGDGTSTVTQVDVMVLEEPRERALCRALLVHALAELDRATAAGGAS
ncbi:hypothetical protein [Streptomyces mirabilis]|uniref:hypothetical protein n=1 Tax=Streptomyces mirabilis TaxID=68239 RepID=UPI003663B74D